MQDFWDFVRGSIIGGRTQLITPFGIRRLTYADYTASGRGVAFIEDYMGRLMETYGNTHTEDDATGTITSEGLHWAELSIKRMVNAGPHHRIISAGAGTTAAVHQLQQILGIYVPPAGKDFFTSLLRERFAADELRASPDGSRRSGPWSSWDHSSIIRTRSRGGSALRRSWKSISPERVSSISMT